MTIGAVRLEEIPATPLAVIRRQVSQSQLSTAVPECCGLVWNALRARNAKAGRNVAVYWDGAIRLEVGVELLGPFEPSGDVIVSATPEGPAATVTHLGPYNRLGDAHRAIREWCEQHHQRLAGPNWEVYGHWQNDWNANPSAIRTDVFYQLAR